MKNKKITKSEENLIQTLTRSYISQRVDAFMFENLPNQNKSISQEKTCSKRNLQGSESCFHANSQKSSFNSESNFQKSRNYNESNLTEQKKVQSNSPIIVISKQAKNNDSRSFISNASCLSGMTFIQAEVAKDFLKNIINDNIQKLNESRILGQEGKDYQIDISQKESILQDKKKSTVMSLEIFVKNYVNNWLDEVVCSVDDDNNIKNKNEISSITDIISEKNILSKLKTNSKNKLINMSCYSKGDSSIKIVIEERELKSFKKSKEMFISKTHDLKEESDIVISEEFTQEMVSKNSKDLTENESFNVPNSFQNTNKPQHYSHKTCSDKGEVVKLINTVHNKIAKKISLDDNKKYEFSNFLDSINEDKLLSRKVTKKYSRQNKTLGSIKKHGKVDPNILNFSDCNIKSLDNSSFQLPPTVSNRKLINPESNRTILASKLKKSVYLYTTSGRKIQFSNQDSLNETKEVIEGNEESYYFYDLGLVGSNWLEYKGEYQNKKKHGFGIWYLGNGEVYEGYFENGMAHGKGKYTSKAGEVLVAFWKNNVLQHTESHRILVPEQESRVQGKVEV